MKSPEDSNSSLGTDPMVQTLIKLGIPVTRENYLEIAYPKGLPEEWTAEHETELPEGPEESATPDSPAKPSQPSFADGSPLLQELKKELLVKGMSDEKAEDYSRQL